MRLIDKSRLEENIEQIALYDLSSNNLFGSSYVVMQNGRCAFKKHFGSADPNGCIPTDDRTVYRLASMTKPITALAALILIDKGFLSLDDKVKTFIPEFADVRVVTESGHDLGMPRTDVSVLHLLTHTSGLGSIKPSKMTGRDLVSMSDTVTYFLGLGLDFEPFTKQAYSGVAGFDALGMVIEKVSGERLESFYKREIFEPLGMSDTTFVPSSEQWGRMMTMHTKAGGKSLVGRVYDGCVFENFPAEHMAAGAGLASTSADYVRFAEALLNDGGGLISDDSFKLYHSTLVPDGVMGNALHNWGMGVRVITSEDYGPLPVDAFGWSGAYGTHFWVDPINRITAVFMKNSRFDGGAGNKSAKRFEEAVFDALK